MVGTEATQRMRGLGLAIARRLVELDSGSLQAESPGAGQGSTSAVEFPRSPVTAAPVRGCVDSQADRSVGKPVQPAELITGVANLASRRS